MSLSKYRRQVDKLKAQYDASREVVREEKTNLREARRNVTHCQEAQRISQAVAQQVQQQVHDKISSVVSRCLEAVFDDPYEFRIVFEQKRGKTDARIAFVRNGQERTPLKAAGGGVADVASFALRLACLLLSVPKSRRVLIMDEPFRHLKPAAYYGPRVAQMLDTLSKEMEIQFIIVQNLEEFKTGDIVEIE